MDPAGPSLDDRFDRLASRVAALETRLATLEGGIPSREIAETLPAAPTIQEKAERHSTAEVLPVIGQILLIIGGAFVLRAMTEAGILAPRAGAAAGFTYAVLWLVLAHRTARAGRTFHATSYGLAATMIAFPLLWETTVQFAFLSPAWSAAGVVAISMVGLFVGWRNRLHGLTWIITVAACVTTIALAVATRQLALFQLTLLVIGLATVWIGWTRAWVGLPWVAAIPAAVFVALMTVMLLQADPDRVGELFRPQMLVALQVAMLLVYVGSLVGRTLTGGRELDAGAIALGTLAASVGLGGAIAVVRITGVAGAGLGSLALVMGLLAYAASFTLIERASAGRTNFIFYSTLALICMLVGFDALLHGDLLIVPLAVSATALAWAGGRWERATLSLHGAVYGTAAAIVSGLLGWAVGGFVSPDPPDLSGLGAAAWIALIVVSGCVAFPVAAHGRTWGRLSQLPKLALITLSTIGWAGIALGVATLVWTPASATALAVERTAVLAAMAVLLACLGRLELLRQTTWLVYPVLVCGGLKLLVEDLPAGRPATLVLSFALYGGALILAPRLSRRGSRSEAAGRSPS